MIYPVILSGGSGTRLWPLSREAVPKQFLKLTSTHSLFQDTLFRLDGIVDQRPPVIVANLQHRFLVAEQLRAINIKPQALLLEPQGRNTAPAVAVAASLITLEDPDALLLILPSDHVISDKEGFHTAIAQASAAATEGAIATFGIKPKWAETGYGYIQRGARFNGADNCFHINQFVEKPDSISAEAFVSCGEYYWNSGMFVVKARHYLDTLQCFRPDIFSASQKSLEQGTKDGDFYYLNQSAFSDCPAESIDYAVMEHTDSAAVVPVDIGWNDVGSWSALWDAQQKDKNGNCLQGDVYADNLQNTYVNAETRMVAALGVKDLVIVETADAVLVTHKNEAQRVKALVENLKADKRTEHITHSKVYRPWGYYETVDSGERFQVKRIVVNPGSKLSLQMHHHRAEHWVVVQGTAKVTRGREVTLLTENQSTYIPIGEAHRLENPGKLPLHMIEVQSGSYLGEDDIVRFEDIYNRA